MAAPPDIANNPAYKKIVKPSGQVWYVKEGSYIQAGSRQKMPYDAETYIFEGNNLVGEIIQQKVGVGSHDKLVTTKNLVYDKGKVLGRTGGFEYDPGARGGKGGVVKSEAEVYTGDSVLSYDVQTPTEKKMAAERAAAAKAAEKPANRPPYFTQGKITVTAPTGKERVSYVSGAGIGAGIYPSKSYPPSIIDFESKFSKEPIPAPFFQPPEPKYKKQEITDYDVSGFEKVYYDTGGQGGEPMIYIGKQKIGSLFEIRAAQEQKEFSESEWGGKSITYSQKSLKADTGTAMLGYGIASGAYSTLQSARQNPAETALEFGTILWAGEKWPKITGTAVTLFLGKETFGDIKSGTPVISAIGKTAGSVLPFAAFGFAYGGIKGTKGAYDWYIADKPRLFEVSKLAKGKYSSIEYNLEGVASKDFNIQLGLVKESRRYRRSRMPELPKDYLIELSGERLSQPGKKLLQKADVTAYGMLRKGRGGKPNIRVFNGFDVNALSKTETIGDFSIYPSPKAKAGTEKVNFFSTVSSYQRTTIRDTMRPFIDNAVWTESGKPVQGFYGKPKISFYPYVEPRIQNVKGYTRQRTKILEITPPYGAKMLPNLIDPEGTFIKPIYSENLWFKQVSKKQFRESVPREQFRNVYPERRGRKTKDVKMTSLIYGSDPLTAIALEGKRLIGEVRPEPKLRTTRESNIYNIRPERSIFELNVSMLPNQILKTRQTVSPGARSIARTAARSAARGRMRNIYSIEPQRTPQRKNDVWGITNVRQDSRVSLSLATTPKLDTRSRTVSQPRMYYPETPTIPSGKKPFRFNDPFTTEKKKPIIKERDIIPGIYQPSVLGLDIYQFTGQKLKKEPRYATPGIRLPTQQQIKKLNKAFRF